MLCSIKNRLKREEVWSYSDFTLQCPLSSDSFIMASIIFTADSSRISYMAGKMKPEKVKKVQNKLVKIFTR